MPTQSHTRNRVDLGRINRRAVLSELVLRGPISRTAIAKATALTGASVSRISRDLLAAGLVQELPHADEPSRHSAPSGPGRRMVMLDIDPQGGFVLGIGLNVFSQSITLANLKNERIERVDLKLGSLSDPDIVIEQLIATARGVIDTHIGDRRRLFGGSVAITGAVDPQRGAVGTSPYLGWGVVSLGERLSQALDIPMRVESLPNAIALAESRFGIARDQDNILLLNCSLGIGASLLLDARVIRGRDNLAGLIGTAVPADGGGDSLDLLAGGRGVLRALRGRDVLAEGMPADKMAAALMAAVASDQCGDPQATAAMRSAGECLARTAAQYVALVAPQTVLLAGPMAASERYVEAFRQGMSDTDVDIAVSNFTGQGAARWVALGEYLIERDIDLDALLRTRAA